MSHTNLSSESAIHSNVRLVNIFATD